ncbi:MAG: NADH-quinone oxidoreductase subunit NuoN [Gammaproteobacteria bacterium]
MTADLALIYPELWLLAAACLALLAAAFSRDPMQAAAYGLAQAGLVGALAIDVWLGAGQHRVGFSGAVVVDPMAVVLKAFIFATGVLVFVYVREHLKNRGRVPGEQFALGLFAVLGMSVMVSAHSLLTAYLGLELLSLSLYSMVAMEQDSAVASEAAMKYFVLGAIASGMLLYGMSMLYGVTGSLDLDATSMATMAGTDKRLLLVFALSFIVIGVAFKLGVVPFHMWLPDVYQGASTSATLFIASVPKIAAFALAIRLLVDGLGGLAQDWRAMLAVLAVLSMAIGNVVAIAQVNIKRMLAYSTIAHMGYLLLGIIAGTVNGYAAGMFYALVYALMSAGAFGMVILLGRREGDAELISDFQGLGRRSPWFALVMMVFMFAMAGVPPFAGFWAKWFVIKEVVAAGHTGLAVAAVLFSVIGAYYYLRLVKVMFFDEPAVPAAISASGDLRLAVSANGVAVLALGLLPGLLMHLCLIAMRG